MSNKKYRRTNDHRPTEFDYGDLRTLVIDLDEVRFAAQFINLKARQHFLKECGKRAGGATIYQVPALDIVCVGCDSPAVWDSIVELVASHQGKSMKWARKVGSPSSYGFVLPRFTNPDAQGSRRPLLGRVGRRELLRTLTRKFGAFNAYPCVGTWLNDATQELVFDESQFIEFPNVTEYFDHRVPEEAHLHFPWELTDELDLLLVKSEGPDAWDQEEYYASFAGRGQRRKPATQEAWDSVASC